MLKYLFALCLFYVHGQCQEQGIGDVCTATNGQTGVCKLFKDCKNVSIQKPNYPKICSFQGKEPIICCKESVQLVGQIIGKRSKQYCNKLYNLVKVKKRSTQVYGGENADPREFPHMAVLGFSNKNEISWGCGGSLISPQHILTAAHCVSTRELGNVKVIRLGDLDLSTNFDLAQPQQFNIKKTIKHPDYKSPSKYHDIAIIELERSVNITNYVKPACLQVEKTIKNVDLIATGWGRLEYGGETAKHLQKITLKEIANNKCRNIYVNENISKLKNGIDENLQICAFEENGDTCQGDSGGPLQIIHPDYNQGHVIVGVTSFGKACGIASSPGVYTRVSNYIGWIESIIWPN